MFHHLTGVFDAHELAALSEAAGALEFEDGARTAGTLARAVKSNQQAADSLARVAVARKVEAALMRHPGFASAAQPKGFARVLVSRYDPGDSYGLHVDEALIGGARADLSFTLFLSDPETYAGGALVIEDRIEARAFRLSPGEAILYPADCLHRVEPVTRGVRLAVVGWVTSRIRAPQRREVLYDLDRAIEGDMAPETRLRLSQVRANLLRMWAE